MCSPYSVSGDFIYNDFGNVLKTSMSSDSRIKSLRSTGYDNICVLFIFIRSSYSFIPCTMLSKYLKLNDYFPQG